MKKLVILLHGPLYKNMKGEIISQGGQDGQLIELSRYYKTTIYSPIIEKDVNGNKFPTNITVRQLFIRKSDSIIDLLNNYRRYRNKIQRILITERDSIFLAILPGKYLGLLYAHLLKRSHKKQVFRIVNDEGSAVGKRSDKRVIRKIIAPFFKLTFNTIVNYLIKDGLNIYTGNIIYNKHTHINQYSVVSSSINESIVRHTKDKKIQDKILFVGYLEPKKGADYLLEAMKNLKHKKLTIVGDGPFKKKLERLKERYQLDNVEFLGYIPFGDTLLDIYRDHDLLIMPSLEERQGKVHLEAMSQGTVPIVTDVGGVYTVIKNNYNGIMIPPHNSTAIVRAVNLLYSDQKLYFRLRKNGYFTAKNNTIEKQIMLMKELIDNRYGE
ncbi:glycosyltransferase family 4 protein [Nanoarchaeota archaeon]